MRQIIFFTTLLVVSFSTYAQPILTAATSNPLIGDVSYNYYDSSGVPTGIAGAGITWNYSSLVFTRSDTTSVVSCISTAYCDSFPASMFAEVRMPDSLYSYLEADAGKFSTVGQYKPVSAGGAGYVYVTNPYDFLRYPVSYGSSWSDTDSYWYHTSFASSHIHNEITNVVDGYGTLITPLGTYTNVLRMHMSRFTTDSNFTGPLAVFHYRDENYIWYRPGFHFPVLMTGTRNDPMTGAILEYKQAQLSTHISVTSVPSFPGNEVAVSIYPNPATDALTIKMDADAYGSLTITNSIGQVFIQQQISRTQIKVNTTTSPAGLYCVILKGDYGSCIKKFMKI